MHPDSAERGIDAAKSQFVLAARQIASDLGIDAATLKHSVEECGGSPEFDCDASGEAPSGIPSFQFLVRCRSKNGYPRTRELELRSTIQITYEEHATPFELFEEDITAMTGHPNYLVRWAGWAVHNFNLVHNPVNLESQIGLNFVRVYGQPQSADPTLTEFQLLMKGLQASKSKVTVLKFRHVDPGDWYRSYSYAIWAEPETGLNSLGLWIFFCRAGGLDSGGWYAVYERIERLIRDLGENATVRNYDIRYRDLERFLLRRRGDFDSLDSRDFDLESLHHHELDFLYPLGQEIDDAFQKSQESFWNEDYAGALRDLRAVIQDALKHVAQRCKVDISDVREPDINKLAGKLVEAKRLDGRLTPWFQAFTSFANLASHGTFPSKAEWENPQIRIRVLGTFVIGRQLLLELRYCVKPYTPLSPKRASFVSSS